MKAKGIIVAIAAIVLVVGALYGASHPALADVTGNCLYTVQIGDELHVIAQNHNVTTSALYSQNKNVIGGDPDLIYPGQHLNVCLNGNGTTYKAASQAIPNPTTASGTYSIRQDILDVFGVYGHQAINIATHESGIDTNAYDPIMVYWAGKPLGHAEGVFQVVWPGTWSGTPYKNDSPYNAYANIRAAYYIFQRDGYSWREWSTAQFANGG